MATSANTGTGTSGAPKGKPKYILELTPINLVGDQLELLVVAQMPGKTVPADLEVKFEINNVAVIGPALKLDANGRGTTSLKVPVAPEVTVGVKTVDPGGRAQIKVNTGSPAPKVSADIDLHIESNRRGAGDYIMTFAIYNAQGIGVGGKTVRLVPKKPMVINDTVGDITVPAAGSLYFDFDVPAEGVEKHIRVQDRAVEVDVRVLGHRKEKQLMLDGPGVKKIQATPDLGNLAVLYDQCESTGNTPKDKIRGLMSRSLYAWFITLIFVTGLAALQWNLAVLGMTVFLVAVTALAGSTPAAQALNRFLVRPFIETNNRWWKWMAAMTLIMGVTWIMTDGGQPLASTTAANYAAQSSQAADTRLQEMRDNLKKYGRRVTNDELPENLRPQVGPTKVVNPTVATATPQDPQRDVKAIRRGAFWVLLGLLLLYTIFAFRDDVHDKAQDLSRVVREKSEGSTGQAIQAAMKAAPAVAAAASGVTSSDAVGWVANKVKQGAGEYGWHLLFTRLARIFGRRS